MGDRDRGVDLESDARKSKPVVWLAGLGAVVAALIGWGFANPTLDMSQSSYALGSALGPAALLGTLFTLIFGRFWRNKGWIAFGVIGAAMVGSILITSERNRASTSDLVDFLRDDLMSAANANAQDPLKPVPDIAPPRMATGDLGELQTFITTMYNEQAAAQRAYLAEIDAVGWPTVLDPDRIQKDATSSETDQLLASVRALVTKYRKRDMAWYDGLRAGADKVKLQSAAAREGLKSGLERSEKVHKPALVEMWRLESQVVNQIEQAVRFLHSRHDTWTHEDGQLIFATDEDVTTYNGLMAAIDKTIAEQDKVRDVQINTAIGKLDELQGQLDRR